jgi:hypothetical protein
MMFWTIYSYIEKTLSKLVHVCTYIVILKNSIKTGPCKSLDYQKWPRFAPKLAVHRPKFWGKIAIILVQRLLVRSGLRTKIAVLYSRRHAYADGRKGSGTYSIHSCMH